MSQILDLVRYPLHDPSRTGPLIQKGQAHLEEFGLFNLEGLVCSKAVHRIVDPLEALFATEAFTHSQEHNIYFADKVPGLPENHAALRRFQTVNHTLCADQLFPNPLLEIYEWKPLIGFLAAVMRKDCLFPMADPLAKVNVMGYQQGEALNWHFDRAEFTVTILLQEPDQGGEFQYCSHLRSEHDPNYDGVGAFLADDAASAHTLDLRAGTLNVFRGRCTAHRVSPVVGDRTRIIAVFSYFDHPGVMFTDQERQMFYGRNH